MGDGSTDNKGESSRYHASRVVRDGNNDDVVVIAIKGKYQDVF